MMEMMNHDRLANQASPAFPFWGTLRPLDVFRALPFLFLLLMAALNAGSAFAAQTVSPPRSPPELPLAMKVLGFQLINRASGGFQLLVPSGAVFDSDGIGKDSPFSDFKFEQLENDQVRFDLSNPTTGHKVSLVFDMKSLTTRYETFARDKRLRRETREVHESLAKTWQIWRGGGSGRLLKYALAEYDSGTHILHIYDNASEKPARQIRMNVPKGIQINILEGRFLLLTQTQGGNFRVQDRFAGSGQGCQVILDLENHLLNDPEKPDSVSWALISPDFVQSSRMGSIQEVLDYFFKNSVPAQ